MDYEAFKLRALNEAKAACNGLDPNKLIDIQDVIIKTSLWAFNEGQKQFTPIHKDNWIIAQDALEDLY